MQRIEFEPEELSVAEQWHGGQSSMLYAIASTGALSRGVERCRPRVDCNECGSRGWDHEDSRLPCRACHGARMTNAQWLASLASRLESEAEDCAGHAREGQHYEDVDALESIAAKCREAVATLTGGAS